MSIMTTFALAAVAVAVFVAGVAVGRITAARRPQPDGSGPGGSGSGGSGPGGLSPSVNQSVTSFGEELDGLSFDPAGPEANADNVRDYRLALDAYDQAKVASADSAALAALQDGRRALIRLDARRNGRPVPIDALPALDTATPVHVPTGTGERFLTVGEGPGESEILIDRPEPGRPAIIEVMNSGEGNTVVTPVIRTADRFETLEFIVNAINDYRGRHLVPPEVTHLKIETRWNQTWAVRVHPLSAAKPLERECHGVGHEVLTYTGGPALLTVQVRSNESWMVLFDCGVCGDGDMRRCRHSDAPPSAYGLDDGQTTLGLPGPGRIRILLENGSWSLHVAERA